MGNSVINIVPLSKMAGLHHQEAMDVLQKKIFHGEQFELQFMCPGLSARTGNHQIYCLQTNLAPISSYCFMFSPNTVKESFYHGLS